jgi:hypothetical protein
MKFVWLQHDMSVDSSIPLDMNILMRSPDVGICIMSYMCAYVHIQTTKRYVCSFKATVTKVSIEEKTEKEIV